MPITLAQIKADKRELSLPISGDVIKFCYRPYALTPELEDRLNQAPADGKPASDGLLELFCELVADWDVKEQPADKRPLPLTPETLRRFPSRLIKEIFEAIRQDQAPPKAPAGGSFE